MRRQEYFYSGDKKLSLDHIVASLPPSFPMTVINDKFYWDGGIFDNTPLGAVLDGLDTSVGADRTIYVVNLFPNKAPVPHNMQEVTARTQNFQIANKKLEDVNMLGRINEVAVLMEALESLPEGNPLKDNPAYQAVAKRPLRSCPENRFNYASGGGFGLWRQRFLARDNRAACERRLQTDRAGAARVASRIFINDAAKPRRANLLPVVRRAHPSRRTARPACAGKHRGSEPGIPRPRRQDRSCRR